jgi:hypothetical protein
MFAPYVGHQTTKPSIIVIKFNRKYFKTVIRCNYVIMLSGETQKIDTSHHSNNISSGKGLKHFTQFYSLTPKTLFWGLLAINHTYMKRCYDHAHGIKPSPCYITNCTIVNSTACNINLTFELRASK